ncbi:MAG: DUF4276 family protein [Caldilineaceae bacterium]|nr:DUF4276 family protein [Caldilineaceae bacterium]
MHFEILVEDQSGKKALDVLIPKIIAGSHTFKIINFRGIGHIPKNLTSSTHIRTRLLLNQLPALLRGYGKTYANSPAAVIVVCDLDNNCLKTFRQDLFAVLHACNPKPDTRFCIAIEEGEAWLLGDIPAIKAAYPQANDAVLNGYINDSICGTWEVLADAVFPGGAKALAGRGWQAVGRAKSVWATRISPSMDVENNASPSFQYFRKKLRALT